VTLAVGIDLGSTYSVVARVTQDGIPEVVPDTIGQVLTPSVVSFAGSGPVVGESAKSDQARGEADIVAFFKSSMGDPAFSRRLGGRDWSATELSGLVLAHLKAEVEQTLGQRVGQAVVTVPEYFTHPQRAATLAAANLAGLDVLRIIGEPTAAALAYGLRPGVDTGRFVVYDLGGGTFDVSVVVLTEDSLDVVAATGDHELGGRDWDDRIALELQERFRIETGADLLCGEVGDLLVAVEQLKRTLSARRSAQITVSDGTRSARYTVTRAEFEAASADLLERTMQLSEQALHDAGVSWAEIDGVLPVGGSTRMPMVRNWVERMSGRPPLGGIHPDHAVALGAAVQATLLSTLQTRLPTRNRVTSEGQTTGVFLGPRRKIRDVVAHSLGMIAENPDRSRYLNSVLLRRNSTIPCRAVRPYRFEVSGDHAELEVFLTQGETDDPVESTYLGRYLVTGFPVGLAGSVVVDVSYSYDENALVTVSATERSTNTRLQVRVDELPDDVPDRFMVPPAVPRSREPINVYLAFDLSGSMHGQPLAEARRAAKAFVSQVDLTTTSVGLIAFSDSVRVELQASQNATEVDQAVEQLMIGRTGIGNAGHPFDQIHDLLIERDGWRYALVLADGVWANQPQAVQQARRCHEAGIHIIAIGFGRVDRSFLDRIASSTRESFFTSMNSLTATFSTIARELTESTGVCSQVGARPG
jgi:molecular chaperone DnaK